MPKTLAVLPLQTTASTAVEWTLRSAAGPWSWYSWLPEGVPLAEALPPKVALSPLAAVIRPPPVTLQPGVL